MSIPSNYNWLNSIKSLPRNITIALDYLGVQEVVGKGSNQTIMAWRDELNLAGVKISGYSDDDIPWCGLFAAVVSYRRLRHADEVVKDPLWARNWSRYGTKSPRAGLGDVLTFVRNGGGHVGFYVAEDDTAYHVLGGNQSNKVCITRIARERCIAVRRPPYKVVPASVKPYYVKASGAISANEA